MNHQATVELIAILRGLTPQRASEVGEVLVDCGFRTIEVPLNSPDPLDTVGLLARAHAGRCQIGAGTVLSAAQVDQVHAAGGTLVVAPNCDVQVIRHALGLGLRMLPGVATATEAFAAVQAGATELKLFPAATYGPGHLKALKSVLPRHVKLYPVGGIGATHLAEWLAAGAAGFGFGSELFTPAYSREEITQRARRLLQALRDTGH